MPWMAPVVPDCASAADGVEEVSRERPRGTERRREEELLGLHG